METIYNLTPKKHGNRIWKRHSGTQQRNKDEKISLKAKKGA